jgi:hypothetical protein
MALSYNLFCHALPLHAIWSIIGKTPCKYKEQIYTESVDNDSGEEKYN